MSRRTPQGEETRLRIIRVAADLFHKQGVRATSPDQVIDASLTGKGQFYYYFKSKEGLVHAVLRYYLDALKSGSYPISYEIDSWNDLESWFYRHIELQKRFDMTRSCPVGTIGNEVGENDELVRQDISLLAEIMKNKLAAFFIREKAAGRLTPNANEDEFAHFCIATIQGAMLVGKIKRDIRPVESTVRQAVAHLSRYRTPPADADSPLAASYSVPSATRRFNADLNMPGVTKEK